jgi:hypothetical protein
LTGPSEEDLAKSPFLLIRHAVTQFNLEFAKVVGEHGFYSEDFRKFKMIKDFIDIPILDKGIE